MSSGGYSNQREYWVCLVLLRTSNWVISTSPTPEKCTGLPASMLSVCHRHADCGDGCWNSLLIEVKEKKTKVNEVISPMESVTWQPS